MWQVQEVGVAGRAIRLALKSTRQNSTATSGKIN